MTRRHLSISFWVALFIVLVIVDLFGVPEFMNDTHGPIRLLGLVALTLPVWPVVMVVVRLYQRAVTKAFVRDQDNAFRR